jgi:polygalacturonase
MGKMTRAIHIKSNLDRGGYVKDIYFRNIKVNEAQYCIYLHKDYYSGPAKPTSFPAHYDNINIKRNLS